MFSMLLLLLACAGPSESSPPDSAPPPECASAPDVTWQNWGHGFFLTYCGACHSATSPNRDGAPENVNFDTKADVVGMKDRIRVRVLEEQSMPLGGGVYEEDLELLNVMLACGL
jgi:uncharacterized membrane protein